ncbi:hypothetical protein Taro_035839 [Colocasia esculenta]|uniref:Uncharacterized protein n=1 Tax=Colocasia esculenta TaxID=4460 RepID=A0A843VZZ7_COLES|nr:hypothetical protein [Colocasia esculenta]
MNVMTTRKGDQISMLGRKVKLCDMYRRPIASGIVMHVRGEEYKIVMGKKLGEEYLEIFVLIAYDPDVPLFVRDRDRETIKDAVGSHIIWLRDFVCVYLQFKFRRYICIFGLALRRLYFNTYDFPYGTYA